MYIAENYHLSEGGNFSECQPVKFNLGFMANFSF